MPKGKAARKQAVAAIRGGDDTNKGDLNDHQHAAKKDPVVQDLEETKEPSRERSRSPKTTGKSGPTVK